MFKLVVLSSVLALVAAKPSAIGLGWPGVGLGAHLAAPLASPWLGAVHAPAVAVAAAAPVVAAGPVHGAYNYRGPLSLAPGQPANILATDGRPLDTLSVNLDRAAHYTARAVTGGHWLKKRSAPLLAAPAVAWSHSARVDVPARLVAPALPLAPLAGHGLAAGHLGWGAPVAAPWGAAPWGAAAWGAAPWGHAGVLGHGAVGHLG